MSSAPVQLSCPTCLSAVAAESAFCTQCGVSLSTAVESHDTDPDASRASRSRRERRDDRQRGPATASTKAAPPARIAGLGPAFDGVTPARTGRRLGALVIDAGIVGLIGGVVWLLTGSPVAAGITAAEIAVALMFWEARTGETFGNAALGLRTARDETPVAPGLGRAAGRAALLAVSHLVPVLGPFVLVISTTGDASGRRRGWHDRASRTVVVDVRALRIAERRGEPRAERVEAAPVFRAPVVTAPDFQASVVDAPTFQASVVTPAATIPVANVSVFPPAVSAPAATHPVANVPVLPPVTSAPVELPTVNRPAFGLPETSLTNVTAAPPAPASYVLTLDTGESMTVSGWGYVGRKPQAPEGEACDHVIEIKDPDRSLSRTHARFGIDDTGFWVEDRGSANGTSVIGSDGTSLPAGPGQRLIVPLGGSVRLGDRVFEVRARA